MTTSPPSVSPRSTSPESPRRRPLVEGDYNGFEIKGRGIKETSFSTTLSSYDSARETQSWLPKWIMDAIGFFKKIPGVNCIIKLFASFYNWCRGASPSVGVEEGTQLIGTPILKNDSERAEYICALFNGEAEIQIDAATDAIPQLIQMKSKKHIATLFIDLFFGKDVNTDPIIRGTDKKVQRVQVFKQFIDALIQTRSHNGLIESVGHYDKDPFTPNGIVTMLSDIDRCKRLCLENDKPLSDERIENAFRDILKTTEQVEKERNVNL